MVKKRKTQVVTVEPDLHRHLRLTALAIGISLKQAVHEGMWDWCGKNKLRALKDELKEGSK